MRNRSHGLTWKKLDLHVHSPASKDYTGDQLTPDEIVAAALAKKLDGIAVADHNSGAWIDRIAAAAAGTNLTVFPAVEVTASGGVGGIHVIGLFEPGGGTKTVESLLARVSILPEQQGYLDSVSPKSVIDVLDEIVNVGGIAVLAHADSSKGVFADMKGKQRTAVIQSASLSAVELVNWEKNQRFVDGSDPEYKRQLPAYRASDNPSPTGHGHSAAGVGTRFSWFKTDGLSLDALRHLGGHFKTGH